MLKLVAVWSPPKPEDRDAFETAYANVHAPLARALLSLTSLDTILVSEGLEGVPADAYRFAITCTRPDKAADERDEQTPEWLALRADAGGMIERFGVTLTSSVGHDGWRGLGKWPFSSPAAPKVSALRSPSASPSPTRTFPQLPRRSGICRQRQAGDRGAWRAVPPDPGRCQHFRRRQSCRRRCRGADRPARPAGPLRGQGPARAAADNRPGRLHRSYQSQWHRARLPRAACHAAVSQGQHRVLPLQPRQPHRNSKLRGGRSARASRWRKALIRYLARELAPFGVRANCVAPSAVDTEALRQVYGEHTEEILRAAAAASPSGRNVTHDDYCSLIEYLASPSAAMIQGQVVFVTGGEYLAA